MITGLIIIMENPQDIRELLENLGNRVSTLAEENRICKNREQAGRNFITLLKDYLSEDDWINLYQSIEDPYIKELMADWGSELFPKDFYR